MTRLLDTMLVCAVATILIVRTQLWLTNYPQLGGRGLHIAHLLWGGLLMLVALVILLGFVSPSAREVAAVVGGVGLGLFIDELGKFVTADNNYFFKPTAAIIYCFFIIFFLAIRGLDRRRGFTQREYLVNVIEILKESALRDLDDSKRRRALALLAQADQSDPLVPELRGMLEQMRSRPTPAAPAATRAARRIRAAFFDVVDRPWFGRAIVAFFSVWALASLLQIVGLVVFATVGLIRPRSSASDTGSRTARSGPRKSTSSSGRISPPRSLRRALSSPVSTGSGRAGALPPSPCSSGPFWSRSSSPRFSPSSIRSLRPSSACSSTFFSL
jgi:hypothetical protein